MKTTKLTRLLSLVLLLCMVLCTVSATYVTADGYYTLTVTTDATENIQNGDTVVATVTLNTTEGLSGYQYVFKYDPEAFELDTYRNAYINSEWKSGFEAHDEWEVPTEYSFIYNVTEGRISNVALSTYSNGDIPAADALTDVAIMGINLIVKDAEKAKGSKITILEDNTLVMATNKAGEDKATIVPAIIPGGAAVVPTAEPTEKPAGAITAVPTATPTATTAPTPTPEIDKEELLKKQIILTIDKIEATVFGELKFNDVAPVIRNDRTMLPARFVAENLGAKVEWFEEEQKVRITKDDIEILIFINSDKAKVNGNEFILDSPAFIENDRTYTPVRFIAEELGAVVDWEEATQTVIITKQ